MQTGRCSRRERKGQIGRSHEGEKDMKSFKFRAVLTGVVITGTLLFASPAWATFPGTNGQIAFAALPTPGAPGMQIFTIEPNGTGLRQITHLDGSATFAHWSPDGTRIA